MTCRRRLAKIAQGALPAALLLLTALSAGGCTSKAEQGVAWCDENYQGYVRDDCIRQMRRIYDGR